jgi:hypothetical protein
MGPIGGVRRCEIDRAVDSEVQAGNSPACSRHRLEPAAGPGLRNFQMSFQYYKCWRAYLRLQRILLQTYRSREPQCVNASLAFLLVTKFQLLVHLNDVGPVCCVVKDGGFL